MHYNIGTFSLTLVALAQHKRQQHGEGVGYEKSWRVVNGVFRAIVSKMSHGFVRKTV